MVRGEGRTVAAPDVWLTCVGGPLAGKSILPGDDVPEGGDVRISDPKARPLVVQPSSTRPEFAARGMIGHYVRQGDRLVWDLGQDDL